MIKKLKLMVVLGTRPEIIRLSSFLNKSKPFFELILVHTGQNYDFNLNEIFFNDLNLKKPKYFLKSKSNTTIQTISNILVGVEKVILKEKPEAFLVLGDTNSCLSIYVAKRYMIPTFHLEAGNRCFDERVPEEINRRLVDSISDINMPYSTHSKNYLLNENFPSDRIIKVGSPMREVINDHFPKILKSNILEKLHLIKNNFFVVSCHREEIIENKILFTKFIDILNFLAKHYKLPIIFSTHPRTKEKLNKLKLKINNLVKIYDPFCFSDYIKLQKDSFIVLSDSGTINEEASILKLRAINIRTTNERPEAMEQAATIMVGIDLNRILQSINILKNNKNSQLTINNVTDYFEDNFSEKVIKSIHSYTNYVNTYVWYK